MIKNDDSDILFKRIKNEALKKPFKCRELIDFVMENSAGKTFHHVYSSVQGLKSTDLLGTAEDATEHNENQRNRDWLIEKIPESVGNLLRFTEKIVLENRSLKKELRK